MMGASNDGGLFSLCFPLFFGGGGGGLPCLILIMCNDKVAYVFLLICPTLYVELKKMPFVTTLGHISLRPMAPCII